MSTPDNRSVNFLACFAGDSITQRRGRWKTPCPGLCRKSRYQDDALCDPFYAADRRIYSLLADCHGRSAWAGSCHCPVRLKFTHAGDCGGWASVLSRHYPLQSSTGFMKFAVNCRSLDRCWHPLKASLITSIS